MVVFERWNSDRDGVLTESGLRKKLEGRGCRVSRYVYAPGTSFPDHSHSTDKIDAVVSGRFLMAAEGRQFLLEAGDMIVLPRGTVHSAEVVGTEQVVSLDGSKA